MWYSIRLEAYILLLCHFLAAATVNLRYRFDTVNCIISETFMENTHVMIWTNTTRCLWRWTPTRNRRRLPSEGRATRRVHQHWYTEPPPHPAFSAYATLTHWDLGSGFPRSGCNDGTRMAVLNRVRCAEPDSVVEIEFRIKRKLM